MRALCLLRIYADKMENANVINGYKVCSNKTFEFRVSNNISVLHLLNIHKAIFATATCHTQMILFTVIKSKDWGDFSVLFTPAEEMLMLERAVCEYI